MTRPARARVVARFDRSVPCEGTVTMDRAAGLLTVRPLRSRRTFELPLSVVADMVVLRVVRFELAEAKKAKAALKKARGGR